MAGDDNEFPLHGCPGRDDLDAFAHGELSPARLEAIAEHLSQCTHCESSLEALHAEETVLVHLRRQPALAFSLDDPACEELQDRARAIPQEHPVTPTVTDGACADSDADAVNGPRLPLVFGTYVLLARLGKGGMGIVYLARQEALKRLVALKMVRAGIYASSAERTRFQREGEAVARVQHPHVVQIHEFGEHEGQLFFSMELLQGGTLTSKLNGKPLAEREAVELLLTLAQTVHAAHQQGVVHRDLKPGNVLFAADGTTKITDFGLAKLLDAEGSDTRSDAILGTPAYMAPEQARGEIRTVGPTTDVYALGTILYEALTGQPPFRGETNYQTLEMVRTGEPKAPSRLRRGLSPDLEAICLTCLEKGPAQRYASAEALADDLERWLRGEPVRVRPRSWLARTWRAGRRYRPLVGRLLVAVVLLALLVLVWRGLSPTAPPDPTLERPDAKHLRELEQALTRIRDGQPATLIDKSGLPMWRNWQPRQGSARVTLDELQILHVRTDKQPALLELLPESPKRFRLRAHVQHTEGSLGRVGIYFAHRARQRGDGAIHCFFKLDFNDRCSRLKLVREEGRPERPLNHVRLTVPVYRETNGAVFFHSLGGHSLLSQEFVPSGLVEPMPWRSLQVEVTPEMIRASWEGKHIQADDSDGCDPRKPLEWLAQFMGDLISQPKGRKLVVNTEWALGGGLGLYVEQGEAAFQSVVIEPLPPP